VPCYRCGARQSDPEAGKPSPWRQGLVAGHQVLVCPGCYPEVTPDLARCSRCAGVRLVRRLDQVECLDCHQTTDASADPAGPSPRPVDSGSADSGSAHSSLAADVARALDRLHGPRLPAPAPALAPNALAKHHHGDNGSGGARTLRNKRAAPGTETT
jgi:hypothetical protein